jgi:hypothetical protein
MICFCDGSSLGLGPGDEVGVLRREDARHVGGHVGADSLERADLVEQRARETQDHLFTHVAKPPAPFWPAGSARRKPRRCQDGRATVWTGRVGLGADHSGRIQPDLLNPSYWTVAIL